MCLLTPEAARRRGVPIDRLLHHGTLEPTEGGYEIRLPAGEGAWALANEFADEESECCPSLAIEIEADPEATVVRAWFGL